jgi:hypothetical protein
MTAHIYKPSKTAMQSGFANTKAWVLDFEPEQPREVEPLMGWTSSGDMRQQLRLHFPSKEEAVAYCERPDARLHADQAGRHVGEPSVDLAARQRLTQNDRALLVEADEVERVLGDVDADCRTASRLVLLRDMECCWCC